MHRSRVLLGALAVLLCAAGCSGAEGAAEDGKRAAKASVRHASAVRDAVAVTGRTTAQIDERVEMSDGGEPNSFTITGGFDLAGDKGRLAVELPGGGISHVEQVFVDGKVYVRGAAGAEGAWASTARDKAEAHYLLRAPLNDPEHLLRQVAAMRQVSKQGSEKVNGAPATHYRGTLDHATVTLRMDQDTRASAGELRDGLGSDLPVYADAWVDGKGRVARARLSLFYSELNVKVTMTLSDFAKPVKVVPPPADDVIADAVVTGILTG